jgi:hypothetical protein
MIDGWHWIAASVEAVLLIILVLLWYDSLRERPGWTIARATRRAALAAIIIPIGFVLVLFVPLWLGGILIAIPLLAIGAMALAD